MMCLLDWMNILGCVVAHDILYGQIIVQMVPRWPRATLAMPTLIRLRPCTVHQQQLWQPLQAG